MKVYRGKQVAGYVAGQTFLAGEILAFDLKVFLFYIPLVDEPLTVRAVDTDAAFEAIGVGCAYQESWGDYRAYIAAYNERTLQVVEKVCTYTNVTY